MIAVGISAINRPYPVGTNLQVGRDVYVDRGYTYTTVPSLVQGASYIQTANNDKASSGEGFLTFTLDQPSIVYVAYDIRINPKPQWLSAFADTGESLVTSDTTLQLLCKPFPTGPVSLGGNEANGKSMYAVAILAQPEPPKPFKVFDATLYRDKPDLSEYGVLSISAVNPNHLTPSSWWTDPLQLPDQSSVETRIDAVVAPLVFFDIEHWNVRGTQSQTVDSLVKYLTVFAWAKMQRPDVIMGYYGVPPIRDYWRAIKPEGDLTRMAWVAENDRLALLARVVDVLFPSLYTFYDNQAGWVEYAVANIKEAKRLANGKPVYPFIWPQYHNSNAALKGQFIPPEYWRLQLETIREHADGVVIWGGWIDYVGPAPWDEQAPWWVETKDFING